MIRDQDESVDKFFNKIKKLYKWSKEGTLDPTNFTLEGLNWNEEPEFYASSSGESKYSNEDRDLKDHMLVGLGAVKNSMKKYKNADKIMQINAMNKKDDQTSHLVAYLKEMNDNCAVPRSLGLIHRKDDRMVIDAKEISLKSPHAQAFAAAVGRAKYVEKLALRNTNLTDEHGINIIRNMDRLNIKHLDLSYNPSLTAKFYDCLNEIIEDPSCSLERIEVEGNMLGDKGIEHMCQSIINAKKLVYLNVSKNNITDRGARTLAQVI